MTITDEDIEFAEGILLGEGAVFDAERRDFIRNLDTLDLQAVPGSGKTTALLAKLLILERHLPLADGRAILILSHTNVAIDEIRDRIGKYCPKLSGYPNFIGTIQSFVDVFLATPYYANQTKRIPIRIDDDSYLAQFYRDYPSRLRSGLESKYRSNLNALLLKISVSKDRDCLFSVLDDEEIIIPNCSKETNTYKELMKFKADQLRVGFLSFNDAYRLARLYIKNIPQVRDILRYRFQYVFIDEVQDMAAHQYNLLEKLFGPSSEDEIAVSYQRIGDKNQAIYDDSKVDGAVWVDRDNVAKLSGSHRLSSVNAGIIERFALYPIGINGLGENDDGSVINIKPHLIVYDEATIKEVLPAFSNIIQRKKVSNEIPAGAPDTYHVIAWNTTWSSEDDHVGRVRMIDYFPEYVKARSRRRKDYDTLEGYLLSVEMHEGRLGDVRGGILMGILKALMIEGVRDSEGRVYTKSKLLDLLQVDKVYYRQFNRNLYDWSIMIASGEVSSSLKEVKIGIIEILKRFNKTISLSAWFIDTKAAPVADHAEDKPDENSIEIDGIRLRLGTVHSVKGATHTATLYLESSFYKSYETQRLAGQFNGISYAKKAGVRVKQSANMVYVGLSRATHLACFAVHRDRYQALFDSNERADEWVITDITHVE